MSEFNPFDLSTPKTTVVQAEEVKPAAKPTVHRVSMGPIFHSRIIKIIAFILSVVLAALLGYIGMNYYLTKNTAQIPALQTISKI